MDILDLHGRGLAYFGDRVRGVRESQWRAPTPCADWDVHALVHHTVHENLWAAELGAGRTIEEVGDRLEDRDLLGDDPVGAYDASAAVARAAFPDGASLERDVHVSYGPVPGAVYLEHRVLDLYVHGWDLAAATGQDPAIPDDIATWLLRGVEAQRDLIRASGVFAEEVPLPPGAPVQARVLALLGRDAAAW